VVLVPLDALPEDEAGVVADGAGVEVGAELCVHPHGLAKPSHESVSLTTLGQAHGALSTKAERDCWYLLAAPEAVSSTIWLSAL